MTNPFAAHEAAFLAYVHANRDLGYGNMMHLISEHWRKQDPLGAKSVGPCYGVLAKEAETLEAGVVVVPVERLNAAVMCALERFVDYGQCGWSYRVERREDALAQAIADELTRLQQNGGEGR